MGYERAIVNVAVDALYAAAGPFTLAARAAGDFVSAPFPPLLTAARLVAVGAYFRNDAPVRVVGHVSRLLAADALLARAGRPVVRVQLALNACSCDVRQLLCPHLLWARLWYEAETSQPFPVSGADWQILTLPSAGRALSWDSALHARFGGGLSNSGASRVMRGCSRRQRSTRRLSGGASSSSPRLRAPRICPPSPSTSTARSA